MAYFAEIDESNLVIRVLALNNNNVLDSAGNEVESVGAKYLSDGFGGTWKQTSYNTRSGVHHDGDGKPDDGIALRANYCGKGWVYNEEHDIFHPQQPFPSWTLDTIKGQWNPPVPMPDDAGPEKRYTWNEDDQQWDEVDMS
jgi:hypothetical protein